ncbi:AAC(3) family N-acetyltransferase [Paenibacillus eucommiae]|uniref:Aminoglycoside N(3)-acetyltransferase n=1 Tax=Paenibacillus eucommiae TaxID=1355755 RepID=A0ABS4JD06_9BACL|nr:AAC(3) family N-acetyltransferase [Paenibacillus eucommiae]MBP1997090.1 aminoglycoside 3-N-acetyltransferase [Paenibacillus eucommiae]
MSSESAPRVTKEDIISAFKQVGVGASDIVLTHSSLKSFGLVAGGPMSVIEAVKETVTESGTVVFPTLVQQDFFNAYRNWDIEKSPSDVGNITETFRLLPDSIRSDQATHSVAAWGSRAAELTADHSAYGPRMGVFGDYCFSYSSPWQKMYLEKARIVFIGIDMNYNTFKHFAEYSLVEHYCSTIEDAGKKCIAMSKIARHGVPGVWPFHDAAKTQAMLDELGFISHAQCGSSLFTSIKADDYVDNVLRAFKKNPEMWFDDAFLAWIEQDVLGK